METTTRPGEARDVAGGTQWGNADMESFSVNSRPANPHACPSTSPSPSKVAAMHGRSPASTITGTSARVLVVSAVNQAAQLQSKLHEQHARLFDDMVFDEPR